jgi:predicted phage-related endonuclease
MKDQDWLWQERRCLGIGGSDATRIMAGDWLALWEEKTGRRGPPDLSDVLAVQLGAYTESFNLFWFQRKTQVAVSTVDCEGLRHKQYGFMQANLDAWAGANGLVECKHTNGFAKAEEIVSRSYWQCLHYLAVTGSEQAYLSVIFGNSKWDYFEIARSTEDIALLIQRENTFWEHVTTDTPPPTTSPAVKVPVQLDNLREVDMTGNNEWAVCAADWLTNKAAAKKFEIAAKGLKELTAGDAKFAFGHGVKVTRAANAALTVKEMKHAA